MKHTIKRLLSAVICLVMVLALLPVGVFADDNTTVYCQAPDNWTICKAYWWGSTGTNPSWPGVDMTQNTDGIWTYDVPSDAAGLIFTNGNGAQTRDLTVPEDDKIMYVFENRYWTTYGKVEVVTEYFVAGAAALCGVAWTPDAAENKLSDTDGDGIYTITYTGIAAGTHEFKVTNGSWDESWGKDGGEDTFPLVVAENNSTVEIRFNAETKLIEASANGSVSEEPTVPGAGMDPAQKILTDAYALEVGGTLDYTATLTGKITTIDSPYSPQYKNISVIIEVEGYPTMPMLCYRIKGDGADALAIGDTITVTGKIINYKGTIEFSAGSTLDNVVKGGSQGGDQGSTVPSGVTYYLVGYINGNYYGCQVDEANMGQYKFVNGKVSATFTADSYVMVKTEGNAAWYMTDGWLGMDVTSATLYTNGNNKLYVPANKPVTFTLVENSDGTLTLSYAETTAAPDQGGSGNEGGSGDESTALTTPKEIMDAAYALQPGETLEGTYTLVGAISSIDDPFNEQYGNITVSITVEGKPLKCYRLAGEGAKDLVVGDIITVTGSITNYNGSVRFAQGCTLDNVVSGGGTAPVAPSDPKQIVDEAYALAGGASLPYNAILTGTIISIDKAYDAEYKNITVTITIPGREDKPIICYRLKGEGTATLAVGDFISVTGIIKNYNGTIEFDYPTLNRVVKSDPNKMIILVDAHDSWDECYVYCWEPELFGGWPGEKLTADASGIYCFELTEAVKGVVLGAGDDRPQTVDITDLAFAPGTIQSIIVGETNESGKHTYAYGTVSEAPPADPVTLSVKVPASWGGAYAYAWDEYGDTLGVWPGFALQKAGDWYKGRIPGDQTVLVLNDGNGHETVDLPIDIEKDVWIVVNEDPNEDGRYEATVTYYDQWAPIVPGEHVYRVVGNASWMGSWDPDSDRGYLKKTGSGAYTKIFENVYAGSYEFEITVDGKWDNAWGMNGTNESFSFTVEESNSWVEVNVDPATRLIEVFVISPQGIVSYWNSFEEDDPFPGLNSMAIVGEGLPGISTWDPACPMGDMEEIREGVFVKTLTFDTPGQAKFLFTGNDRWDENWTIGASGNVELYPGESSSLYYNSYSSAITLTVMQPYTLKFELNLNGTYPYLSITVVTPPKEPTVEPVTLSVKAPDNWAEVYAYSWDSYGAPTMGDWPGTEFFTKNGPWYQMEIAGDITNLVISDGYNGYQTYDLEVAGGMDIWIVIGEVDENVWRNLAEIHYSEPDISEKPTEPSEPTVPEELSNYRVVGNAAWMGNWMPDSDAGRMAYIGNGVYTKTFEDVEPGDYEFKITKDGKWDNAWGQGASNYCFSVGRTCDVTITFTLVDGVGSITVDYMDYLLGDVNGDGKLNVADTSRLYSHTRGNQLTDPEALKRSDINGDGKTNIADVSKIYGYVRGVAPEAIVDEAYALEEGASMDRQVTLTGRVSAVKTAYDANFKNITVEILVTGRESKPILCYRLKGDGVDRLAVGDTITVEGSIRNYHGIIEMAAGTMTAITHSGGSAPVVETDPQKIVDAAYALAKDTQMAYDVTLTGRVSAVKTPYDASFKNITVEILVTGRESKPILCYRLKGDGCDKIAVGDTIQVVGRIKNYNGTIEFDAGCTLLSRTSGGAPVTVETDPARIMAAAGKLAENAELPYKVTLSGKVTSVEDAYNAEFQSVTVIIAVSGANNQALKVYRLKGDGVDKVAVNDTITVEGNIKNYYGELEMVSCTMTARTSGGGQAPVAQTDYKKIVDEAYALQNGASLSYTATLEGRITELQSPYDAAYGNMTVAIVVVGREDKPIVCYRMKGDSIGNHLCVGDTITVEGKIRNYNGTIEFDSGCKIIDRKAGSASKPSDPKKIVDAAFALAENTSLPYFSTLTGVVKSIDEPYTDQYKNVTLTMTVQGSNGAKDIKVYRMKGNDAVNVAVGNTITVTGVIKNYVGTDKETGEKKPPVIEFDSGCFLETLIR